MQGLKTCRLCSAELAEGKFYRSPNGKLRSECAKCHTKQARLRRSTSKRAKELHNLRGQRWKKANRVAQEDTPAIVARRVLNHHLRDAGVARPMECSKCENIGGIQAHHEDYTRPLDVDWLCTTCHTERHWPLEPK